MEVPKQGQNISVINYNNPTINMNFNNSNEPSEIHHSRQSSNVSQPSKNRRSNRTKDDERFFETLNYPGTTSKPIGNNTGIQPRAVSALKTKLILQQFTNSKTDGLGAQRVRKLLQQNAEQMPREATSVLISTNKQPETASPPVRKVSLP